MKIILPPEFLLTRFHQNQPTVVLFHEEITEVESKKVYETIWAYTDGQGQAYQPAVFCSTSKYFSLSTRYFIY